MLVSILLCLAAVVPHNAQSPCNRVPFVNRAGWNAREPTAIINLTQRPLAFYVIHHTGQPPNCYDDETCVAHVQEIQNLHFENKWTDIGCHFLVGENGKVYEGRGWNREGAYAPSWTNASYGICIIGDFRTSAPNNVALNTVRTWMDCGIELGYVAKNPFIIAHRQQRPDYTECPGDGAFNVVKTWPRFCPYQYVDTNFTDGETPPLAAHKWCERELDSSTSTVSSSLSNVIALIISLLALHHVWYLF